MEEAIERHDWYVYESLCQINPEMGFHKLLFDFNDVPASSPSNRSHHSSAFVVQSPIVEITGTTAKITYSNHVTISREWQLTNGQWKMTSYTKQ